MDLPAGLRARPEIDEDFSGPHPSFASDAADVPDMVPVRSRAGLRHVAVSVTGPAKGFPVVLIHGTPGSRLGPKPRSMVLHEMGVRMFAFDRPGYGWSDRAEGRCVGDAAEDVAAIADRYDLQELAVVGRSGGGPHALAVAAKLPALVTRVAVLVSLAPAAADNLDWFQGMTEGNVQEYRAADAGEEAVVAAITDRAKRLVKDPEGFLDDLEHESRVDADRRVLRNVVLRRQLRESYLEALRDGPYGWIDDVLAFRRPWGFSFSDIVAPTKLWHGRDDGFSPYRHTTWLSARIRDVEFELEPGLGHFAAVEMLPQILSWLLHGNQRTAVSFAPPSRIAALRTDRSDRSTDTRAFGNVAT